MNHDYLNTSKRLLDYANQKGIKIDLTIDGDDHDNPDCIPELNLYAPKTFSKSMFEMDLQIRDNVKKS